MKLSRVVQVLCVTAVLVSCGSPGDRGAGFADPFGTLATPRTDMIVVSSDSPLATQLSDNEPSAETASAEPGVIVPAAESVLLTIPEGSDGQATTQALADAFTIDDTVHTSDNGGWAAGESVGAGELVVDGFGGMGAWTFNKGPSSPMLAPACTTMPLETMGSCIPPVADGPPDDVVTATVLHLLEAIDVTQHEVGIDVVRDEFGTHVSARLLIEGAPSNGWSWQFRLDDDGWITQAFGPNQAPEAVHTVDLIELDEVVDRVGRTIEQSMPPFSSGTPPPSTSAGTHVPSPPATTELIGPEQIVSLDLVHEAVWDLSGRQWLVPAFEVNTRHGLTTTVYAIDRSLVEIVDLGLPPRTTPAILGIPQTMPGTIPLPAPAPAPPSTSPVTAPTPTIDSTTTSTIGPGGIDSPPPCPGLAVSPEFNEMNPTATIPVAPSGVIDGADRDDWGRSMADAILAAVVGLPIDEATRRVQTMCWTVTIGHADITSTTATPDMLWNRIVLIERDGRVVDVTFD